MIKLIIIINLSLIISILLGCGKTSSNHRNESNDNFNTNNSSKIISGENLCNRSRYDVAVENNTESSLNYFLEICSDPSNQFHKNIVGILEKKKNQQISSKTTIKFSGENLCNRSRYDVAVEYNTISSLNYFLQICSDPSNQFHKNVVGILEKKKN